MEPRKGCRICMRDLPPGALTPEILLPEGFTALRAKSPKSYNQQIIRCTEWEDTCIPPRSIGPPHSYPSMSRNRFRSGRTYFEKRTFWRGRIMLGVTSMTQKSWFGWSLWSKRRFHQHHSESTG